MTGDSMLLERSALPKIISLNICTQDSTSSRPTVYFVAAYSGAPMQVRVMQAELSFQLRPDQAWFWHPAWQAAERDADQDLAEGRYDDFGSMDEFIEDLERLSTDA